MSITPPIGIESTKRYTVFNLISRTTALTPLLTVSVICLQLSIAFLQNEEDLQQTSHEFVGVLRRTNADTTLAKIRLDLHDQISETALPLQFHFLRAAEMGFQSVPWQEEPHVQLGHVLFGKQTVSLFIISPPKIILKQEDSEKLALLQHVRELERKLALARYQTIQAPSPGIEQPYTLFRRALIRAKAEGYIEQDPEALEPEYLELFTARDLEELFGSQSSPFPFMKLAATPKLAREYMEQLQLVLQRYRIKKTRLYSGKYWTHKVLRDMQFVREPSRFAEWAKKQPWRDDPMELSAYLASQILLPGGMEDYTLFHDNSGAPTLPLPVLTINVPHKTLEQTAKDMYAQVTKKQKPTKAHGQAPCDSFCLDVTALQYGYCTCGFHRTEHSI